MDTGADMSTAMPDAVLRQVFSALDQGFVICDVVFDAGGIPVDYRFVEYNQHFEAMTGLRNARGRTALELIPNLERHWVDIYGKVVLEQRPRRFQQGSEVMGRWFDVFAMPVEPYGRFVIVFDDKSAQHRAELELERALDTSRRLLQELTHRTMNSLSMIGSVVAIEARTATDPAGQSALRRVQARVQSVANLYRTMGRARTFDSVVAEDYLTEIADGVMRSVGVDGQLRLNLDIAPVELSTRVAAPLGLIVNELMTNSVKYAFPGGRPGHVQIMFAETDGIGRLTVADDGDGIPEGAATSGPGAGQRSGLGAALVRAFVEQLGGRMTVASGPGGTRVDVNLPLHGRDGARPG